LNDPSKSALSDRVHVLLIEDNKADADLVELHLEASPRAFDVDHCATLSDGLASAERDSPSVILLDIGLPDVTVDEALDAISRLQRIAPLVVLTGQSAHDFELEAIRRGAEEFLEKRLLDRELLIRTIDHATERHRTRERLELMNRAVDSAREGMVMADMRADDEPLVFVSEGFAHMTGYDAEEVRGKNCRFLQGKYTDSDAVEEIRHAIDAGRELTIELQNQRKNGEWFWNELSLAPVHNEDGDLTHYVGIQRDVTRRIEMEQENARQRRELKKYERIVENSTDAVMIKDTDGRYEFLNRRAQELLGTSSGVLLGKTDEEIFGEPGKALWDRESEVLEDGCTHTYEETVPFPDLDRTFLSTRIPYRRDGDIVGIIGICRDITDRQEMRDKLHHRAHHDWLTDLPNRFSFRQSLKEATETWLTAHKEGRPTPEFAVVFVDIDGFKAVNDSFGHPTGDEVLRQVADRLVHVFRGEDLITRAGGDEYKLLLSGVPRKKIHQLVRERLETALGEPFQCMSAEVFLTVSAGVAHSDLLLGHQDEDELPIEEMSRAADRAMYDAKDFTGNAVQLSTFESAHSERWSLQRENELRVGLQNGEVIPFYQPVIRLDCTQSEPLDVIGYETLARWRRSEDNLVMPGDFISLAERSGLIADLSETLLEQACRDFGTRSESEMRTPSWLLINLSPNQLARLESVGNLTRLARERAPDGVDICFEVVETALIDHPELVAKLSHAGFKVFIDDFGTGYSSFSRLREIPVDGLKLDMEFVHGIGVNSADESIVKSVCSLGRDLELPVIAEGVETREQFEFLCRHDCYAVQGFWLQRPRPFSALNKGMPVRAGSAQ
jgi:diguanylate cyclase (GGDEF)-like protein/PAS domain S-box-containing protein